jgi:hypothetical protein
MERIVSFNSKKQTKYQRCNSILPGKSLAIEDIQNQYPDAKNWIGKTSSGVSIHSNTKSAIENAIAELIERHTVLKAIAAKISPVYFRDTSLVTKDFIIPKNVLVEFYYWRGPLSYKVALCRIIAGDSSMYSFGAHKDLKEALNKAFLEATGMIVYMSKGSFKHNKFSLENQSPIERVRDYHLNHKDNDIWQLLSKKVATTQIVDSHIRKRHLFYTNIKFPEYINDRGPLVCVRVVSPLLQPLFFDKWNKDLINPLAIQSTQLPKEYHIIT